MNHRLSNIRLPYPRSLYSLSLSLYIYNIYMLKQTSQVRWVSLHPRCFGAMRRLGVLAGLGTGAAQAVFGSPGPEQEFGIDWLEGWHSQYGQDRSWAMGFWVSPKLQLGQPQRILELKNRRRWLFPPRSCCQSKRRNIGHMPPYYTGD